MFNEDNIFDEDFLRENSIVLYPLVWILVKILGGVHLETPIKHIDFFKTSYGPVVSWCAACVNLNVIFKKGTTVVSLVSSSINLVTIKEHTNKNAIEKIHIHT